MHAHDRHQRRRPYDQRPCALRKPPKIIPQRLGQRGRLGIKRGGLQLGQIPAGAGRGREQELAGRVAEGQGRGEEVGERGAVGGGDVAQAVEVQD